MKRYKFLPRIFCLFIFLFLASITAYSATRVVTKTADTNDNVCNGDCSLREAIAVAQNGDVIVFSALFNSPQTISLTGFFTRRLDVTRSVTIQGPGANLLTITGNNADRVFEIFSGTNTSISGINVTGGDPQNINFGSVGGGFIVKSGAVLSLNNMTVYGNSAYDGGGIYIENSATLNITNSTISNNFSSQLGGGIYNDFGTINATNVTISTNGAGNFIGGIYNFFGTTNLTNSTLAANGVGGVQNSNGAFNLRNTIIQGSVGAADTIRNFNSQGYNLIQNPTGSSGFGTTGDILGQSAQLGALQNNGGTTSTHKPACTSPAIDSADPNNVIVNDQRGNIRPIGLRSDIGSIETGCSVIVTNNNDSGAGSLRTAIANSESGGFINFDPTFFNVPRTITLLSEIVINKDVNLTGVNFLTINGNDTNRIFNITSGLVNFTSLNFTNGRGIQGGAIYNNGTLNLNGVTIYANKGFEGGGIYNNSTMTAVNSTFSGNLSNGANSKGGGIYNQGTATIVNSTFTNNATEVGGGIYQNAGSVSVANTIIGGNSATNSSPDVFGTFTSQGSNLVQNTTGSTGFGSSGDILGVSPQLNALQNNGGLSLTHQPINSSVSINSGNPTLAVNPINSQPLTIDQRGQNRSIVGVDIGSFEVVQYIVTNGNNSGSGSLRLAISDAPSGSSILFSSNFFNQPRIISLTSGEINIDKDLTINAPPNVTIDANLNSRIFNIQLAVTLNLDGLNLTRGNASNGAGGAILNFGTLNASNCTISSSTSLNGGGIANGRFLNLTNSTIIGNSANDSGGISNGGLNGIATIVNSTISGNTATVGSGGGINNFVGNVQLTNVTIAYNSAAISGGGIVNQSGANFNPRNTLIAHNTAGTSGNDIFGAINSQGYNLIRILNSGDGSGFGATDFVGTSSNPINAGLRPLSLNGGTTPSHALLVNSIAVNNGDPNNVLLTDQRGVSRPRAGRADIGSIESSTIVADASANGLESLRQVIQAASDGDEISFDPSFFNVPRTINLAGTGEIQITKALTIQGPGANLLTISGGNLDRVFGIAPGLSGVTINDLTITQGGNVPNGGGIFTNSRLNLNNVVVTGNASGSSGGGIYNNYQTLNLNNCTISNNTSFSNHGGGIFVQNIGSGTPTLTGIINARNSTFFGNEARSNGLGGGIFNNQGTTRISNSTFSANSAVSFGSAVYHGSTQPIGIVNSTFTLNNGFNTVENTSPTNFVNNTIIAGNTVITGDIGGFNLGSNNLIGNGDSSIFVNGVNGNIVGTSTNPTNPNLSPLGNFGGATNTHALFSYSLARNAGNNSLAVDPETGQLLTTDQRGANRIIESLAIEGRNLLPIVDIGAFEFQAPTSAAVSISGKILTANGKGIRNVQLTLTDSNGNTRITTSSSFGYYRFDGLQVGENYILQVTAKRYIFQNPSRIINLTENLTDADFVADGF